LFPSNKIRVPLLSIQAAEAWKASLVTYYSNDDSAAMDSDTVNPEDEDEAGGEIGKVIKILSSKIEFVWPNSHC
jgi:hypothetical protein